jgi:hypothetical protein
MEDGVAALCFDSRLHYAEQWWAACLPFVYVMQCHVLMAVFACKWPLGSPILQPDGGISFTRLSV